MKTFILFLSIVLVSFQEPKKIQIARVYFAQNSSEILEINPIDKKTKTTSVLNEFAKRVKSEDGGIKLMVCTNYDETNRKKLDDTRLTAVRDALIKLGVTNSIQLQYPHVSINLTVHSKGVIEAEKSELKKDSLKAYNRFVEIKYLARAK
jgi:hypothetical protein